MDDGGGGGDRGAPDAAAAPSNESGIISQMSIATQMSDVQCDN